jgi:hypothetical protein
MKPRFVDSKFVQSTGTANRLEHNTALSLTKSIANHPLATPAKPPKAALQTAPPQSLAASNPLWWTHCVHAAPSELPKKIKYQEPSHHRLKKATRPRSAKLASFV